MTTTPQASQNTAIAAMAYTVMRAYRMALGEHGGPAWEAAPQDLRERLRAEVEWLRSQEPAPTPERLHARWSSAKLAAGWENGPRSDTLKLHPRLGLKWDALPREQQAKGDLWLTLVRVLAPAVVAVDKAEAAARQIAQASEDEQRGALRYIAALVNRFCDDDGQVSLTESDMLAALSLDLMRADTDDNGLVLAVAPAEAH